MIKLLFVEDDDTYAYAVQGGLELLESYDVRWAKNGKEALDMYGTFCPDVVVSDVEMPEMNGYDLARAIRAKDENVVILLATGLTSPKDLHKGYELDIDEYVKKPYIADELHLRIQAILKRTRKAAATPEYAAEKYKTNAQPVGEYTFDAEVHTLSIGNCITQKLTPLEAQLLAFLLENRDCLVPRADILQRLWATEKPEFSSRSLDVFVSKLRKYLSKDSSIKIVNKRGRGLRLVIG
ncbi:MAG: response regulator transcription factor [Bacteroidia bacterium]|nr:response regulator transcription factor [Bacteroidia bacterium]